jgi:adenylosuccinate lyase
MIDRYSRPEMKQIWSVENKYKKWLEVEICAVEAWAELGVVPKESAKNIREKADFDIKKVEEIEERTKHDVIAFLTNVGEYVGEDSRFIHLGLTSSDMLDTALAVLMKESMELIVKDVDELLVVIKERAFEHKNTIMIGRTHGIHAEPITFGLKLAIWFEEMKRNKKRLENALETISFGKISGAVGTYAYLDPKVEEFVCEKLGLQPAPVSNQIIQRDRYAEAFASLAILSGTVEKIATEIRHLQRTEVLEAEEYFSKGQKGSSAMPHKRNPILSENLCGLARVVRSSFQPAIENCALWHERDISHSSVERFICPDAFITADFMLGRLKGLIKNLLVYPERMLENLNKLKGLVFSQHVMLELTKHGISREKAYEIVQRNAMQVWNENKDFKVLLLEDNEIKSYFNKSDIENMFDLSIFLRHVDTIYKRVFGG